MFEHKKQQKSPQKRFLFILGLTMMLIYAFISLVIFFFDDWLRLDPIKFPRKYQLAFASLLMVYALIRFVRIIRDSQNK